MDYKKIVENEIKKNLEIMDRSDYVFPTKFKKSDYIFVFIVVLICLAFLIFGAFL